MAKTNRKTFYGYFAVTVEEDGKYYAHAMRISDGTNVKWELNRENIVHANVCPTMKRAKEIATFWNDCYKRNGTYMFQDAPFS